MGDGNLDEYVYYRGIGTISDELQVEHLARVGLFTLNFEYRRRHDPMIVLRSGWVASYVNKSTVMRTISGPRAFVERLAVPL